MQETGFFQTLWQGAAAAIGVVRWEDWLAALVCCTRMSCSFPIFTDIHPCASDIVTAINAESDSEELCSSTFCLLFKVARLLMHSEWYVFWKVSHDMSCIYVFFFERCWLIKKIWQNVGPRLKMSALAEPAGWKAYCRRFRGERLGGGINLVPSLFVEKKRGSHRWSLWIYILYLFSRNPPLLLDFLRMRKFQNFDSEPWEPFFSNLCRWRRIRGGPGPFATPTFFFSEIRGLERSCLYSNPRGLGFKRVVLYIQGMIMPSYW